MLTRLSLGPRSAAAQRGTASFGQSLLVSSLLTWKPDPHFMQLQGSLCPHDERWCEAGSSCPRWLERSIILLFLQSVSDWLQPYMLQPL